MCSALPSEACWATFSFIFYLRPMFNWINLATPLWMLNIFWAVGQWWALCCSSHSSPFSFVSITFSNTDLLKLQQQRRRRWMAIQLWLGMAAAATDRSTISCTGQWASKTMIEVRLEWNLESETNPSLHRTARCETTVARRWKNTHHGVPEPIGQRFRQLHAWHGCGSQLPGWLQNRHADGHGHCHPWNTSRNSRLHHLDQIRLHQLERFQSTNVHIDGDHVGCPHCAPVRQLEFRQTHRVHSLDPSIHSWWIHLYCHVKLVAWIVALRRANWWMLLEWLIEWHKLETDRLLWAKAKGDPRFEILAAPHCVNCSWFLCHGSGELHWAIVNSCVQKGLSVYFWIWNLLPYSSEPIILVCLNKMCFREKGTLK